MTDVDSILKERFRLSQFRTGQRDIIKSVLAGRDALAVMPTGGGKSLCYQLPALCRQGVAVVISPLIALMEDQVRGLSEIGVAAGCLHSGQSMEEKRRVFAQMRTQPHFVLYLSPERVQKAGFGQWAKTSNISLFAIDESHCISQWGPDFRKDYYRLPLLREIRPEVPILALTATATPQVLADIVKQLGLRQPDRHIHGFYRPNLFYQVEACENEAEKFALLRAALQRVTRGRALVYCGTRRQAEEIVNVLQPEFPALGYYHAGLSAEDRSEIQRRYSVGELKVLAATNAFGMGIDHPDVRAVIHFQMPANIESLYQEMGRAGRDGNHATCLLLYSRKDKGLHAYFIGQAESDQASINRRWRALDAIVQFSEGGECRHAGILTYFKDSFRLKACGHCDVCDPNSERRVTLPATDAPYFEPKIRRSAKGGKSQKSAPSTEPLTSEEQLRAEMLRTWRKQYADEHDIPAFIVFSDRTLRDLARRNPRTAEDLVKVYGIGDRKVEALGSLILDELEKCRG